ncbi:hypothetical protein ACWGE0_01975 [Lentzea sp. NPDC054927]
MKRGLAILAATLSMTAVVPPQAGAADLTGWAVGFLPMPEGYPARAHIDGTDSNGNYSGTILTDQGSVLVTWTDRAATVHGRPAGFNTARVNDQNRAGMIVGVSTHLEDPREQRAWIFDARGFTLLARPAGYTDTWATAANDRGDIFGAATRDRSTDEWEPFVWPADNPAAPKAVGLPKEFSERLYGFVDIDHDGSLIYNTHDGPGRWKDGTFTALPTYVDGVQPPATAGHADGGQFVGKARLTTEVPILDGGVYWPAPDARPQPLPGCTWAFDMNRDRLVLGTEETPFGTPQYYGVWHHGSYTGRLPALPTHPLIAPRFVGDDGAIVGIAREEGNNTALGRPVIWRQFSG